MDEITFYPIEGPVLGLEECGVCLAVVLLPNTRNHLDWHRKLDRTRERLEGVIENHHLWDGS